VDWDALFREIAPLGLPLAALGLLVGAVVNRWQAFVVAVGVAVGLLLVAQVSAARIENATDVPILAGAITAVAIWIGEGAVGMLVGILAHRFASRFAKPS
jgi:uncharacterized membrane protein